MAARRLFVNNGVRQISRWPFRRGIMNYNDREGRHLQIRP